MLASMDYTAIDWDATGLIVINMQNDFVDGAMPVPGTEQGLAQLERLVAAFRGAGRPIVHAIRLYEPGSSDVDPVRRAVIERGDQIVAPGTSGAEIPATITGAAVPLETAGLLAGQPQSVGPDEVIFYKPRWSAFFRTGLQSWLTERRSRRCWWRAAICRTVLVPPCSMRPSAISVRGW